MPCSMFLGKSFYLAELKFAPLKKNKKSWITSSFQTGF